MFSEIVQPAHSNDDHKYMYTFICTFIYTYFFTQSIVYMVILKIKKNIM